MKRYYNLITDDGSNTADLYIFGEIVDGTSTGAEEWFGVDFGDVSGLSIIKDITGLPDSVKNINVYINSPGGLVGEGLAIYNTLRHSGKTITTYCEGIAASAASVVFMAGSRRIVSKESLFMIHAPWVQMVGNAEQMRLQADELDVFTKTMKAAYLDGTGVDEETLDKLIDGPNHEGTWMTGEETKEYGFATGLETRDGTQEPAALAGLAGIVASAMHADSTTTTAEPDTSLSDSLAAFRAAVDEMLSAADEMRHFAAEALQAKNKEDIKPENHPDDIDNHKKPLTMAEKIFNLK